ncbi:porin [Massilia sp. S19_KUP03_FR1]|uniref:porin n=1 Tax=Massilia sp. S19_KUP03_FR1 TaxID=3025503 RepID=UPI002FCD7414
MKKTLFALAACATLTMAGAANAQSNVTFYGLIDAFYENTSNVPSGTGATATRGTVNRISSSGMNTSRWGLRGNEDLGNGLKAVFQLESGFLLDTGTQDTPMFKRQANVGLEGNFGRVVIGRTFTTVYDFVVSFDPMAYAQYYSWAVASNGSLSNKMGMATAFDNTIKYSGGVGAFKYGVSYGVGEVAGNTSDAAKLSSAATYEFGPVTLLATFEKINGTTVAAIRNRDKTTAVHLGAIYANGPLKIQAVARDYKLDPAAAGAADVKGTLYWAGVNYQTTPAITLTGVVYHLDVKNVAANTDADPTLYVARLKYALSKRTDLYSAVSYAKARNGKLVSMSRDEAGGADKQRGLTAGIQHRF